MKLRCIAIDDEPLALDLLEDNLQQVPFLQLVKRCKNAFEATEILKQEKIDLLFLDIQMPGLTGLQFLKALPSRPMVILITAYKNFALDGYELDVLDYLVKPVAFERFLKSANKALEYYHFKNDAQGHPEKDYFFVYARYNLIQILYRDISHIEGLKDYIKIFLVNTPKPIITRLSMKAIEKKLPSKNFMRVHKSYIVALDKIVSIRNNQVQLPQAEIPLGEHYKNAFYNSLDRDILLF
jgi:DNA-binding LytR/AlgR family response regulator